MEWHGWRWAVPALGCFLVLLAGLGPDRSDGYLRSDHLAPFLASVASNLNNAAYLTAALHSEHNTVRRETLEWTVRPPSTSNVGSFRLFGTNALLQ